MDPHTARAQAERWLEIAGKLLATRDLLGSRTFAIRARESDPRNPLSDQILAVVDTLLAAEKRVNSGYDWYAILQLAHLARDTDLVASQYRRLVMLLNPDRNRLPYADYALRLVVDAWSVLSDPAKKWMYDNEVSVFLHQQQQQQQQQMNLPGHVVEPPAPPPLARVQVDPTISAAAASAAAQINTFQFFHQQEQPQQQQQQQWFYHQPQPQQQQQLQERELLQQHQGHHQHHHLHQQPDQLQQPQQQQQQQQQQWFFHHHHHQQQEQQQRPPPHQLQERELLRQNQGHQLQHHLQHRQRVASPAPPQQRVASPAPQQQRVASPAPPQQRVASPVPPQQRVASPAPPQQRVASPAPQQQRVASPAPQQQRVASPAPPQPRPTSPAPPQQRPQPQPAKPSQQLQQQRPQVTALPQQPQLIAQPQQPQIRPQSSQSPQIRPQSSQPQQQPTVEVLQASLEQRQMPPQPPLAPPVSLPAPEAEESRRTVNNAALTAEVGGGVENNNVAEEAQNDDEDVVHQIESFWTACPYCYYMYEYPKDYQDCTLRCQNCRRAFQALQVPNPPMSSGGRGKKRGSFCCWGFFPMGFSMTDWKKNNQHSFENMGASGSGNWNPFSPMFHCPVKEKEKEKKMYYDDDGFLDDSDSSDDDDSSDDWRRNNSYTKVKRRKGGGGVGVGNGSGTGRGRVGRRSNAEKERMAGILNPSADGAGKVVNGQKSQGSSEFQQRNENAAGHRNDLSNKAGTSNGAGGVRTPVAKNTRSRKKLDLNVEFSNEVEDHAATASAGNGEHEEIEDGRTCISKLKQQHPGLLPWHAIAGVLDNKFLGILQQGHVLESGLQLSTCLFRGMEFAIRLRQDRVLETSVAI